MFEEIERMNDRRFDFAFEILDRTGKLPNKDLAGEIFNEEIIEKKNSLEEALAKYFLEDKREYVRELEKELNTYDKGITINIDEDNINTLEVLDDTGATIKRGTETEIIDYVKTFDYKTYELQIKENEKSFANEFMQDIKSEMSVADATGTEQNNNKNKNR